MATPMATLDFILSSSDGRPPGQAPRAGIRGPAAAAGAGRGADVEPPSPEPPVGCPAAP